MRIGKTQMAHRHQQMLPGGCFSMENRDGRSHDRPFIRTVHRIDGCLNRRDHLPRQNLLHSAPSLSTEHRLSLVSLFKDSGECFAVITAVNSLRLGEDLRDLSGFGSRRRVSGISEDLRLTNVKNLLRETEIACRIRGVPSISLRGSDCSRTDLFCGNAQGSFSRREISSGLDYS